MTATGHRPLIQAALDDWWLTTDPAHPDLDAAAHQIETHLLNSGYHITPHTPRSTAVIHRLSYTLAALAFASSLTLAALHHWALAIGCLIVAAIYTGLADRQRTTRRRAQQAELETAALDRVALLQADLTHEREQRADLRQRLKATSDACSEATNTIYRVRQIPRLPHTSQQTGEHGRAYTRGWESVISCIDDALNQDPICTCGIEPCSNCR
jgi:hypothetical protein